jgi:hypothetical protein
MLHDREYLVWLARHRRLLSWVTILVEIGMPRTTEKWDPIPIDFVVAKREV